MPQTYRQRLEEGLKTLNQAKQRIDNGMRHFESAGRDPLREVTDDYRQDLERQITLIEEALREDKRRNGARH